MRSHAAQALHRLPFLFFLALSALSARGQWYWSDPATWPGGTLPQAGDVVVVPAGQTIVLDVDPPPLGGLRVRGTLRFAEVPLHLTTDWIMVMGGHLQIGTEASPHMNPARITLTGDDEEVMAMDMGGKLIGVMFGGVLDLHGIRRDDLSWSQLDGSVAPGDTVLRLADAPTWRVGDEIVVAPSGADPLQAERVTVTGVQGYRVAFTPPLQHPHYGVIETQGGRTLDMRAEVGLLTRNIVIEGDEASDTARFGGHVMVMNGCEAYVEGVEFRRMGQTGRQGRYPLHWHLSGMRYGNYARFNSVHDSYHRAFVIHGTNGVTLEGNVAFEITSHAYVMAEDGNEEDNAAIGNLGVLIRKIPRQEDFAFPSDSIVGGSAQAEHRPGVFWMKNPNQVFIGNHAAGSVDGNGFFFDGIGTAISVPADFFRDNVAHSHWSYFEPSSFERYPPRTRGHGLFIRKDALPGGGELHFRSFTAYKNTLSGIWMEEVGQRASDVALADNGTAAILMRADMDGVTIVHRSGNTATPDPAEDFGGINTLTGFGKKKEHRITDVSFHGFTVPEVTYEDSLIGPGTAFAGVTGAGSGGPVVVYSEPVVQGAIVDEDGSLMGMGPALVFHEDYRFAQTADCVHEAVGHTRTCPSEGYAFVRFRSEFGASAGIGPVQAQRAGGGGGMAAFFSAEDNRDFDRYQYLPMDARYAVRFPNPPSGALPSLYQVDVTAQRAGYVALRIPVDEGFARYVLDENDHLLPRVDGIGELGSGGSAYVMDLTANALYLYVRLDAANGFRQTLTLFRVPESAFLRAAPPLAGGELPATVSPNRTAGPATVRFSLREAGPLTLTLSDATGRVATVWSGHREAGEQTLDLDFSDRPQGLYLWRLEAPEGVRAGRVVVAR
jgi:hypothetical protein